jgi:hypothetical protein
VVREDNVLEDIDQLLRDLLAAQQPLRVARLVLDPDRRLDDVPDELPAGG